MPLSLQIRLQASFQKNVSEFSKWFLNEFKSVTFPPNGSVFDFYVDNQQQGDKFKFFFYKFVFYKCVLVVGFLQVIVQHG